MKLDFDIEFTPATPEEEYEIAKQRVANMLDLEEWQWLKVRIFDEHLSWSRIMDIVAASL